MPDLDAHVGVRYVFGAKAVGADGYTAEFVMDDALRSWLVITRWNLHYRHWRALIGNAHDLFTKVIWRKLWRHS